MQHAWIAGKPAALDTAIAAAAKLLDESRRPLIAGLGTDIAGARAAIALAERIGAVIDHMNSDALLRDLDVMRSFGTMQTTPTETRVRADTLLLVGPGLSETWLALPQRFLRKARQTQRDVVVERRTFWLCPGHDLAILAPGGTPIIAAGKEPTDLPALLGALRARVAGRPTGKSCVSLRVLDAISRGLKAARFGVVLWSAAALDSLTIEMLCGLVNDLNATTRFSTLPLVAADNAVGVLQACSWMTGFPMRTGFGRGLPEHDPWLFDSRRIVDSRETDCVIWISAYRPATPAWQEPLATIALTGHGTSFCAPPSVHIEIGRPGVDHAGVEHISLTGSLASVAASHPSDAISVADVIARIASALPGIGERQC